MPDRIPPRRSTARTLAVIGGRVALLLVAAIAFAATANPDEPTDTDTATASTATTSPRTADRAAVTLPTRGGEPVTVSRVIDGDTFELSDGRKVRLLGIDSCESDTPGGVKATNDALTLLTGGWQVTLHEEPTAPDTDQWGRLLRYVDIADVSDFGEWMVRHDHTGIYTDSKGRQGGDASQTYLDQLRGQDLVYAANPPSGRECGEYPPPPPPVNNDDDDTYVPAPDNDDDGESWFCRKRRWC